MSHSTIYNNNNYIAIHTEHTYSNKICKNLINKFITFRISLYTLEQSYKTI